MPYKCPFPDCVRVLPTKKGLMGHIQMVHGIAYPSKYLSEGENPQLKENLPSSEGKGQPEKINPKTLEVPSEEVQQTEDLPFSTHDLVTEEPTFVHHVQPPEEYYEDPRITRLRIEQELLLEKKEELLQKIANLSKRKEEELEIESLETPEEKRVKRELDRFKRDIRELQPRVREVSSKNPTEIVIVKDESKSSPPLLPLVLPMEPPEFLKSVVDFPIKKLNELDRERQLWK
jgi:hypothetical protein